MHSPNGTIYESTGSSRKTFQSFKSRTLMTGHFRVQMNCEELSRLDARSLAIFAGNLFDEQLCRRVGLGQMRN